jgi:hypothetical protein
VPLLNRAADRFQRALEGERVTDAAIAELLETSRHLVAVGAKAPAADPAFVAALRERLMAEAATMPAPSAGAARAAAARRTAQRTAPVVVVVGRGLPRLLAGAVASLLLVAAVVGVASRGAVPGQALYPVKGWLDGVQVRLASSDLDRGRTYLAQAQEHISDARELAEHDGSPEHVNVALRAAIDSVRNGQQALDTAWARTGNPQALIAARDFATRALPQVEVLRTEVRAESMPLVAQLEALLQQGKEATARRIAACGSRCSELVASLDDATAPSTTATTSTTAKQPNATSTARPSAPGGGSVTVPADPVGTAAGGGSVPLPSVSASVGGVGVGAGGGGVSASSDGVGVGLPTVSATLPLLPSATVNLPLPSATLGTGGVGATVPNLTLGGATLPGVTLSLP